MCSKTFTTKTFAEPINEPATKHIEITWIALLLTRRDGGGEAVEFFSEDEAAAYNADPDHFAADHFGFDNVEDYREWVACNGAPLCSERARTGKPCSRQIGRAINYSPQDWLAAHRSLPCEKHGGDPINAGPMPPAAQQRAAEPSYRRRRHPVGDDRRCEAITKPPDHWNGEGWAWGPHQCGLSGTLKREGRRVCRVHRDCADVAFIDGGKS